MAWKRDNLGGGDVESGTGAEPPEGVRRGSGAECACLWVVRVYSCGSVVHPLKPLMAPVLSPLAAAAAVSPLLSPFSCPLSVHRVGAVAARPGCRSLSSPAAGFRFAGCSGSVPRLPAAAAAAAVVAKPNGFNIPFMYSPATRKHTN